MIYPRENPVDLGGGKLKQYLYFDTMADYPNLPGLDRAAPGSDAGCVDTGDAYVLNGAGEWRLM